MNRDHEIHLSGPGLAGPERLSDALLCASNGHTTRVEFASGHPELDLDASTDELEYAPDLQDAIDLASDQGVPTWLRSDGKHVAAIVPVDVLEHDDKITEALEASHG